MRIATVIGLPRENQHEYLALHRSLWPGVREALERHNVTNYSIYLHEETLFSYWEYGGENFETDMAALAADPRSIEWNLHCARLQRSLSPRAPAEWWMPMTEVFHLD